MLHNVAYFFPLSWWSETRKDHPGGYLPPAARFDCGLQLHCLEHHLPSTSLCGSPSAQSAAKGLARFDAGAEQEPSFFAAGNGQKLGMNKTQLAKKKEQKKPVGWFGFTCIVPNECVFLMIYLLELDKRARNFGTCINKQCASIRDVVRGNNPEFLYCFFFDLFFFFVWKVFLQKNDLMFFLSSFFSCGGKTLQG